MDDASASLPPGCLKTFVNRKMNLPRISIVTPSYNQAEFLPNCIDSIHHQGYDDKEHIIIDGGSVDGSVDILRAADDRLTFWISEKDGGQYDAINKGFARSTGEIMAWLNADDVYFPWTLRLVGEIFACFPQIEWLTTLHPFAIDARGIAIKMTSAYGFDKKGFFQGNNIAGAGWPAVCFIQQESTFWRRSLWERAGGFIDSSFHYAGDFDLWARFFQHAQLFGVDLPLGIYRRHPDQKTSLGLRSYLDEAIASFRRHGGDIPNPHLQALRLTGRNIGWIRRGMLRLGLIEPAPRVTYNWGTEQWELEQA